MSPYEKGGDQKPPPYINVVENRGFEPLTS